jgi:NADPH:quinone reductase-like Zn-dependent oxidoreductase
VLAIASPMPCQIGAYAEFAAVPAWKLVLDSEGVDERSAAALIVAPRE